MTSMGDARAAIAKAVNDVGVGELATLDPTAIPPMILVDAGTWSSPAGVGGWDVTIPVRVVVPPPGNADALATLESLVEQVLHALGWAVAQPGTWAPAPNLPPLPAYTLTYTRTIPNPDC